MKPVEKSSLLERVARLPKGRAVRNSVKNEGSFRKKHTGPALLLVFATGMRFIRHDGCRIDVTRSIVFEYVRVREKYLQ